METKMICRHCGREFQVTVRHLEEDSLQEYLQWAKDRADLCPECADMLRSQMASRSLADELREYGLAVGRVPEVPGKRGKSCWAEYFRPIYLDEVYDPITGGELRKYCRIVAALRDDWSALDEYRKGRSVTEVWEGYLSGSARRQMLDLAFRGSSADEVLEVLGEHYWYIPSLEHQRQRDLALMEAN